VSAVRCADFVSQNVSIIKTTCVHTGGRIPIRHTMSTREFIGAFVLCTCLHTRACICPGGRRALLRARTIYLYSRVYATQAHMDTHTNVQADYTQHARPSCVRVRVALFSCQTITRYICSTVDTAQTTVISRIIWGVSEPAEVDKLIDYILFNELDDSAPCRKVHVY
jgi:hypothetical protein